MNFFFAGRQIRGNEKNLYYNIYRWVIHGCAHVLRMYAGIGIVQCNFMNALLIVKWNKLKIQIIYQSLILKF